MIPARTGRFALLLMLGGCAVGPRYQPPAMPMPPAYSTSAPDASDPDIATWWKRFNDPVLDDLIARARAGNLDMRQAAARVAQARAREQATRASGGPGLNAGAQGGYTRLSRDALPPALAGLAGGSGLDPSGIGVPGESFATFQTGFDASWELDLFGGQARANEAARARVEAAIWSRRDAEVMLAAEVANIYQQYRLAQRRLAIADEGLQTARELLAFIQTRTAHGLAATLDERHQQGDIEERAAQRADLAARAQADAHGLALLLGLDPLALRAELSAPPAGPSAAPDVPPGLPSELLQRRPDIRAAERRLAAATADIGVATADLYPRFSLTGALRLASRSLSDLVESGSVLGDGGGRLSLPLVGRGASRATVKLREAQADEALGAWQADVLSALRDVEEALTRLDADRRQVAHLAAAEQAARDAADTSAVRQRHGLTDFTAVLTARQQWASARDALARAEGAAARDVVALYKALGGGWDNREDAHD